MAASSLILLTILFAYLKLDSSKRFNQTFWVAMAGLAPTLAIAYVVAIGQALSTSGLRQSAVMADEGGLTGWM
jgi:hypothetical protein